MPVELLVEVVVAAAHVHQGPALGTVRQEYLKTLDFEYTQYDAYGTQNMGQGLYKIVVCLFSLHV